MRDDAESVSAFLAGDHSAFEEIYKENMRGVYAFILSKTRSRSLAEDLTSETFLRAIEKLHTFRSARGSLRSWLIAVARNIVIDHFRSVRPSQSIEDAWDVASDDDTLLDADLRLRTAAVREALSELSAKQRDALILRAWQGLPFAEIAAALSMSEAACKMNYRRAVESVRRKLLLFLAFFLPLLGHASDAR